MSSAARISGSELDTSAESDGLAFGVVLPVGATESLAEEEGAPDDACEEEEGLMRRGDVHIFEDTAAGEPRHFWKRAVHRTVTRSIAEAKVASTPAEEKALDVTLSRTSGAHARTRQNQGHLGKTDSRSPISWIDVRASHSRSSVEQDPGGVGTRDMRTASSIWDKARSASGEKTCPLPGSPMASSSLPVERSGSGGGEATESEGAGDEPRSPPGLAVPPWDALRRAASW